MQTTIIQKQNIITFGHALSLGDRAQILHHEAFESVFLFRFEKLSFLFSSRKLLCSNIHRSL